MAFELDETRTVIGTVEVGAVLDTAGESTALHVEGLGRAAAIGHLQVALDRLRKEEEYAWATCPQCGQLWSEHGDDEPEGDE